MPQVRITNTLSRSMEAIEPVAGAGAPIRFYSCGPTVYDDAHIGNFRSFLNADILRRTLELTGMKVRHIMNITDVGHMTDDANADGGGEDKMAVAGRRIAEAKKAGKLPAGVEVDARDPYAIAEFYAGRFLEDARHLGLKVAIEAERDPALMPRPTKFVKEMLALIERLISRGHAYVARDGVVYFDVASFPAYGRLSGNTVAELKEGAGERISSANQAVKKNPADFMLWKPDPTHLMRWPSPWGEGYPGWHLECSAMAAALLGETIDLHSGGEDNIFPHHECEIAQSCAASGKALFSRIWFHTRFLIVEGEKMSKSRGNFFTARDLFARGATPAALRLELTRSHYRTQSNFTLQGLADCQRQIDRWARVGADLARRAGVPAEAMADSTGAAHAKAVAAAADRAAAAGPIERGVAVFTEALCDDLNMARAIGSLNEACADGAGVAAASAARELAALRQIDSVLGVFDRNTPLGANDGGGDGAADPLGAAVEKLLADRSAARGAKNWKESDRIRDELLAMGVAIKDGPQGTTWSRVVR